MDNNSILTVMLPDDEWITLTDFPCPEFHWSGVMRQILHVIPVAEHNAISSTCGFLPFTCPVKYMVVVLQENLELC